MKAFERLMLILLILTFGWLAYEIKDAQWGCGPAHDYCPEGTSKVCQCVDTGLDYG